MWYTSQIHTYFLLSKNKYLGFLLLFYLFLYRRLAEAARNAVLKQLCIQEIGYLDEINSTMSTSREFVVLLTYRAGSPDEVRHSVTERYHLATHASDTKFALFGKGGGQ